VNVLVTLLEAAKDSERTYRESILSTPEEVKRLISNYAEQYKNDKQVWFNSLSQTLHDNPILRNPKGLTNNHHTFESNGHHFLKQAEIQEFYENGFVAKKYRLPHLNQSAIEKIQYEFIKYNNKCTTGLYDSAYCKLPDYVGHLYIPSIVKLFHDNYDFLVQKSMSIFNVPEEELFFSVGIFMVDATGKGENVHQDQSYYFLDQSTAEIATSLITFHTAINVNGGSHFTLFPGTHKEILHNLNTLKYIYEQNIPIDDELAMYTAAVAEYIINDGRLPYKSEEVFLYSHVSRYAQIIYILNKYKNNDVVGFPVDTNPGECILFDPAILHSNGDRSATINELIASCGIDKTIQDENISRLSLAIRVMHTKNKHDHFLWMADREKMTVMQKFLDERSKENQTLLPNGDLTVNLNKNVPEFYTVLSNNQLSSPSSPYFSVKEMYDLHAQTGAYL
jgi:ectoine hydroxylase-related dioxygenase (phytanoyl-CoA dioxygenase family)